jgi:D-arabinose 1-dehydrogenase-like Zn-dependent alcohol dehydrogenase
MNLTYTKSLLLISILLCFIVVGAFVYGYYNLVSLERRYESQLQLVANNTIQAQQAQELQRILRNSESDRAQLKQYFLDTREVASLLATVEKYMNNISVTGEVGSITPQPVNDLGVAQVQIPYSVQGSRTNVQQLLRFLETLPYHSVVTEFSMQRRGDNESVVKAQITLAVSYIDHD